MPTLSLATTFCTSLSACSSWCWFMLHINILMSSLRGLRKKQKPPPRPAPFAAKLCSIVYAVSDWVSCNPLNVISQWQSQQSTQQDQSPLTTAHLFTASLFCLCLRTFVLCRGGRKLLRASHNPQLQLQPRSTRTCLSCPPSSPSANSIIANRMQMSWTAKLNSKQAGETKERERGRKKTQLRIKLTSGFPISKLHIAYVFCCLIYPGIVCFL